MFILKNISHELAQFELNFISDLKTSIKTLHNSELFILNLLFHKSLMFNLQFLSLCNLKKHLSFTSSFLWEYAQYNYFYLLLRVVGGQMFKVWKS